MQCHKKVKGKILGGSELYEASEYRMSDLGGP